MQGKAVAYAGQSTPQQVQSNLESRRRDQDIAASLNRMGMPTGQGKTWTVHRVGSLRGIHGYRSADKDGEWLTLREAAAKLGVSHHQIRKLIKARPRQRADHARRAAPDQDR